MSDNYHAMYEQVNACFVHNPDTIFEHYSADDVYNHLGVDKWIELVHMENLNILEQLVDVGMARNSDQQHSMWGLIASGVAQHQSVDVLQKYGAHIPLEPYLRECLAPFHEEFFRILPQYISPSVVRAARKDIAEYFDMVQQKERLTAHTKQCGVSLVRKI